MSTKSVAESLPETYFDIIVIGAGFAGIHLLHKLVEAGMSARVLEAGPDVGGFWRQNAYPGARTDSESWVFSYAFADVLQEEWDWSEQFPTQPEVLAYLKYAVRRFGLSAHIQLNTRADTAMYDESTNTWTVTTQRGQSLTCTYLVTAVGVPVSVPDIRGLNDFQGRLCVTTHWPAERVDFAGKRVVVVGTGVTGVQIIPVVARTAARLTVLQRTAHHVLPSPGRTVPAILRDEMRAGYDQVSADRREDPVGTAGVPGPDTAAFVRSSIRTIVGDPDTAETLCPAVSPTGAERVLLGHFYYETFNRNNVELVDVSREPIVEVTPGGVRVGEIVHEADIIIIAAGPESPRDPLARIDIRGMRDIALNARAVDGPRTQLGTAVEGFPNLFVIVGPQIPFANAPTVADRTASWFGEVIETVRFPADAVMPAGPRLLHRHTAGHRRARLDRSRPWASRPSLHVTGRHVGICATTCSQGSDGS